MKSLREIDAILDLINARIVAAGGAELEPLERAELWRDLIEIFDTPAELKQRKN